MAVENQSDSNLATDPDPRYRALVEHATDGIAVVQDARFVFGNRSIATLSGRPLPEFIGLGLADIFHPDDLPSAAARHAARQRGEPVEDRFEIRIVRPGGEVRWVGVNVVACDWNGRPASLGLVTDVTEQKRAAEALSRSEAQHRQVVESANEGISVIQDQRFVFANRRMGVITGYPPDCLLTMPSAVSLIHPDDHALVARIHGAESPLGRSEESNEYRIVHRDGSIVWVADNSVAIEWQLTRHVAPWCR